ncbi:MAG: hypothetical protein ACR2LI_13480 [Propionibacteriaceae bacterium]
MRNPAPSSRSRRRRAGPGPAVVIAAVIVISVVVLGWVVLRQNNVVAPIGAQERCVATSADHTVVVDLDQAHYASIIVGISVGRGLPARAASIALATAYQESGLRNLDHGDRDSVGLFQQRPSQGWGSEKQLMDPFYAAGRFYDALVKVNRWETDDINDVAQKVQRSGYPEAYRDHEADGRTLASVLTGHSAPGLSCLERRGNAGDAKGLRAMITEAFGSVRPARDGATVRITARSGTLAWAYGQFAVANAAAYGVSSVRVAGAVWTSDQGALATWSPTDVAPSPTRDRSVLITVRG